MARPPPGSNTDDRLASERGRIESLRARLWAEAQRATFRGMLDTVFDASCVCSLDGGILSSTPQMDTVLLGQLAVGANASGLTGERLILGSLGGSALGPTQGLHRM